MKKTIAVTGAITLGLFMSACSNSTEHEEPETAAPATTEETPNTPTNVEFGETVTLDFAGSTWDIQINEPRDVTEELAAQYEGTGLDFTVEEGTTYIGVPGKITRTSDTAEDPFGEVHITGVIEGAEIKPDSHSMDETPTISDIDTMQPGDEADFMQLFLIDETTNMSTVTVTVGEGEETQTAYFGEPVETTPENTTSEAVQIMKDAWNASTPEQQAESRTSWDLDGGTVTDKGVAQLIQEASEHGINMDETEAHEFLEWVLTQ